MRRLAILMTALILVGCAGTGTSPLDNQPGTRFNSASGGGGTATSTQELRATATDPVAGTVGDPAIWVNRLDPTHSLIFGTDRSDKSGALYAFSLDGKVVQKIEGLNRPMQVDVGYGLGMGSKTIDFLLLAESKAGKVRVLAIDQETGKAEDVSGDTDILGEESGGAKEPAAIAAYRRADGAQFVFVAPKSGGKTNFLAQYRLVPNNGKIDLKLVRRFGGFSGIDAAGNGEVSSVCVDDPAGVVFYADKLVGIRKYWADPDHVAADKELAVFGTDSYKSGRSALAIYPTGDADGYLMCVDQVEKKSRVFVYTRAGASESDLKNVLVSGFEAPADNSDGIEATNRDLGIRYPDGILVMKDSAGKRFLIFDWRDIAPRLMKQRAAGATSR